MIGASLAMSSGVEGNIDEISGTSGRDVFAVGREGTILRRASVSAR